MSFFIKNKGKRAQAKSKPGLGKRLPEAQSTAARKKKRRGPIEEIESDSDDGAHDVIETRDKVYSSSEEEEETAQEKKLRLAKQYLAQIKSQERDDDEDDDDDEDTGKDYISDRLKQDLLEQSGKLQKQIAETLKAPSPEDFILFRGHQLSVTCVVISPDNNYVYSGGKDCSIIKWSIKERRRVQTIHGGRKGTEKKHIGHTAHILAMALSSDGKYLATGDRNKLIHVWDAGSLELVHTFKGHRDAVSGLTFRKDTHQLYSCSHDRSVKIWNVDERAYVETLFGHQDKVTAIDSLARERAVTAGGRDSSLRVWKIVEESQLVFNAHSMCSIDCVALINESNMISGADDNSLSVWSTFKKKPLVTVKNAHIGGSVIDESPGASLGGGGGTGGASLGGDQENWITAVAAMHSTDVVASGSKDGCIRLWKCGEGCRKLEPLFTVPMVGFVNCLQFSSDGGYLVAGIGQEHRLGRWWSNKKAKNGICIIPLKKKTMNLK